MKEYKNKWSKDKVIGFLIFACVYLVIHLYISPNFGDEIKLQGKLLKWNNDVFAYLHHRYFVWSSRSVLDFVMIYMSLIPGLVWKVLDFICIIGLYLLMSKYSKDRLALGLLLAAYPFMHMASAGWIATTTNYLWPFTVGVFCFFIYGKFIKDNFNIAFLPIYIIGLLYAVNSEIISVLFIVSIISYVLIEGIEKSKKNIIITIITILMPVLSIINIIVCPGNSLRTEKEIAKWMPEFPDLSIVDKLRLNICATIMHFTSIPNVLFVLFSFLLIVVISKKKLQYIVASVGTLVISLVITAYYFITEIVKKHNLNYINPNVNVEPGSPEYLLQWSICFAGVLYLLLVIYCLIVIFKDKKELSIVLVSYFGGGGRKICFNFFSNLYVLRNQDLLLSIHGYDLYNGQADI
ncbi:MAG: hypothetical protein K6D02_08350 [Lachnospiraceae bacterium]|nr:hypothetical protein [Lachnospiraceae bacterium]